MLTTSDIARMFGLDASTVYKRAPKCPGTSKFGKAWAFPDTQETVDYFDKVVRRRKSGDPAPSVPLVMNHISVALGHKFNDFDAAECPGVTRSEAMWLFPNTNETWEYFRNRRDGGQNG